MKRFYPNQYRLLSIVQYNLLKIRLWSRPVDQADKTLVNSKPLIVIG